MEAALWELAEGDANDEVEVIIRLHHPRRPPAGIRIVTQFGAIVTCRLPRRDIVRVRRDEAVASMKAPGVLAAAAPPSLAAEEHEPTDESDHRRPRTAAETGLGGVVAVIDWGCDFTHPNFRHADGRTRLVALWDQTAPYRPDRPNRYGYGVVHAAADIDRALGSADPAAALGYDWRRSDPGDAGAHGTHVMDIAGGSGRVGPAGVAPQAELVFVHLASRALPGQAALGDSVCLLEAVDFIFRAAGDRPVCINASMGRCLGSHDGFSLVEQAFDAALEGVPNRFIAQSTGNYYDRDAHAAGQLRPGQVLSIPFLVGEADVTPNELEVWYPGRDVLGVQVRAPGGEMSRKTGPDDETTLRLGGRDACRVYHRAREPNNLDNTIHVYLYAGAPGGRWELVLTGDDVVDGRFNAWIERDAGCPGCQARFDAAMASPLSTTGSIANGFRPVAVGAYDAHDPERRMGAFSSAGPTRDGRIKPDLVAPGVDVLAARSTPRASGDDDDEPRLLVRKSGTSMAAPHVTGTVALMFQAAGRPLHIQEVRNLLLTSTRPADLAHHSVHRVGSGYLDIDAAIAATRAYAAGTHPALHLPSAGRREFAEAGLAASEAGLSASEAGFGAAEAGLGAAGGWAPAAPYVEPAEATPSGDAPAETTEGAMEDSEWGEDTPPVTLGYCIPDGRITDPFYRDTAEKEALTGRRTGRARHLGIDVSTSNARGGGADDARRGLPVYAALRPSIDVAELQAVRAVNAAGDARAGIGVAGTGTAVLDHAVVSTQPWSSQDAGAYGGVLGMACRYTYTRADGSSGTLTLYVEWLHLITPDFLPRDGAGTGISAAAWAATGKGIGFGPRMRGGERLSAADLTGGAPLLVGYLGATQFPHVHIQAAARDGTHGYLRGPRFDPVVMLRTSMTLAAPSAGTELAEDLEEAYGPFAGFAYEAGEGGVTEAAEAYVDGEESLLVDAVADAWRAVESGAEAAEMDEDESLLVDAVEDAWRAAEHGAQAAEMDEEESLLVDAVEDAWRAEAYGAEAAEMDEDESLLVDAVEDAWRAEDAWTEADEAELALFGASGSEWHPEGAGGEAYGESGEGAEMVELAESVLDLGGGQSPEDHFGRVLRLADGRDPASADPATLFRVFRDEPWREGALAFQRVLGPGAVLGDPLRPGDVLLRRIPEDGYVHVAFVAGPDVLRVDQALGRGWRLEGRRPGYYVRVVEAGVRPHRRADAFARRVADPRGRLPRDQVILRPRAGVGVPEPETLPWEQLPDLETVRTAIRRAAVAEMTPWRAAGRLIYENAPGQMGHLVRYWLATAPSIRPDVLPILQQRATAITYPAGFFAPRPGQGPAGTATATARRELVSPLPAASARAVQGAVDGRLGVAFRSFHDDETPWSAAFVLACIRKVTIDQGLERMDGATPRGRDTLLRVTANGRHLDYIREAYARRSATGLTYRAYAPAAHPVAVGDIVVMDRGATGAGDVISISTRSETGATHGDIVVVVNTREGYALTLGGNLADPEEPNTAIRPARDSVRCRRFPLTADGRLDVSAGAVFQQERNDAGTFAPLADPATMRAGALARGSMLRVFGLLRLTSAPAGAAGEDAAEAPEDDRADARKRAEARKAADARKAAAQAKKAQADAEKFAKELRPHFQAVFSTRPARGPRVTYGSKVGTKVNIVTVAPDAWEKVLEQEGERMAKQLEPQVLDFAPEIVARKLVAYYKVLKEPYPADRLGVIDRNTRLTPEERAIVFNIGKALTVTAAREEADKADGIYSRGTGRIHLKHDFVTAGVVAHEMAHAYADGAWDDFIYMMRLRGMKDADKLNEGMTTLLSAMVIDEWFQTQPAGVTIPSTGYDSTYTGRAKEFIKAVGDVAAYEAYFAGEIDFDPKKPPEDSLVIGKAKKPWKWPWR